MTNTLDPSAIETRKEQLTTLTKRIEEVSESIKKQPKFFASLMKLNILDAMDSAQGGGREDEHLENLKKAKRQFLLLCCKEDGDKEIDGILENKLMLELIEERAFKIELLVQKGNTRAGVIQFIDDFYAEMIHISLHEKKSEIMKDMKTHFGRGYNAAELSKQMKLASFQEFMGIFNRIELLFGREAQAKETEILKY